MIPLVYISKCSPPAARITKCSACPTILITGREGTPFCSARCEWLGKSETKIKYRITKPSKNDGLINLAARVNEAVLDAFDIVRYENFKYELPD